MQEVKLLENRKHSDHIRIAVGEIRTDCASDGIRKLNSERIRADMTRK